MAIIVPAVVEESREALALRLACSPAWDPWEASKLGAVYERWNAEHRVPLLDLIHPATEGVLIRMIRRFGTLRIETTRIDPCATTPLGEWIAGYTEHVDVFAAGLGFQSPSLGISAAALLCALFDRERVTPVAAVPEGHAP